MNTADHLAEKILNTLEGQRFNDFYNGVFEEFIQDPQMLKDTHGISKIQILEKIKTLFNL